jgi:hypothetical protein
LIFHMTHISGKYRQHILGSLFPGNGRLQRVDGKRMSEMGSSPFPTLW